MQVEKLIGITMKRLLYLVHEILKGGGYEFIE